MPRDPNNNPTERIGRILDEVQQLEDYVSALLQFLPADAIGKLSETGAPSYPRLIEIEMERRFRSRFLGQILASRKSTARSRFRLSKDHHIRGRKDWQQAPSLGELQEAFAAEVESARAATIPQSVTELDSSGILDPFGTNESKD